MTTIGAVAGLGPSRWVLTGRDEELRFGRAVLRGEGAPGGLVLRGAAGVGKSRLAAEIVDGLGDGFWVQHVTATHGAATIPFGSFSHLLGGGLPTMGEGPDDAISPSRLEPPDLLWAVRQLRATLLRLAGNNQLVLVVDDAHALDDASVTLVQQLALTREARLLVTVRSSEPCPAAVVGLWKDEVCDVLELQPLSHDETGALLAHVLGAWFDSDSLDRMFTVSGGNPLFVRELLSEAQAVGSLREHRGLIAWHGTTGTARLAGLVEGDLMRLGEDERAFMDVLAVGEPIPVEAARQLASSDVLAALETSGFVTFDHLRDRQVRFAHPLFGEVRRAQLGPLQLEHSQRCLADAFDAARCIEPDDRLRVVCWRRSSQSPIPAGELHEAAIHARACGDEHLAEQLARAARDAAPTPAIDLLLAEILELQGSPQEAASLLDGLAARLGRDDQRARSLTAQIRVLAHALGRPDDAEAAAAEAVLIEDPVWRGFVSAQWATTLVLCGRVHEAGVLGRELFATRDDRVRLRALPAVNVAAFATGRLEEALAAAKSMVEPALVHHEDVPIGASIVFSALALDLLFLGRLDELDGLLTFVGTNPAAALPANRAYVLLVQGSVALHRGQIGAARRALAEAADLFAGTDPQGYRPSATGLLAEACALGGDAAQAREADLETGRLLEGRPPRLIDLDSERARAWAPVAAGDRRSARTRLVAVADRARDAGAVTIETAALHDAVRLGAGIELQRRLASVSARVDGERSAAMHAHACAILDGDPDALVDASQEFEAFGAALVAAEVLGDAARRFGSQGLLPASRRSADRSRALLARCHGAVGFVDLPAAGPGLTPRELQVARLATAGRSSKGIAEELHVSRRTVDNQLSRVYAKLGIDGRHGLAKAMAAVDLDAGEREGRH